MDNVEVLDNNINMPNMCGDGASANGNHESSSEDEHEEIKEELKTLKEDFVYHEFLLDVSLNRQKPDVDDTKDASDGEFAIAEELSKHGKESLEEVDGSSSSSDEEDIFEEAVEDVDNEIVAKEELEAKPLDVKVPPKALKEAAERYPPFWRFKDHLRRATEEDYNSDEDPNYNPQEDEAMDAKESRDVEGDEDGSSSDSDESNDEVKDEAADDEIANLVDMIDDLNIPNNDVEIEDEEEPHSEQPSLLRAIVDFDTSTYKSDEDPDFEAPEDALEPGAHDDDSSSTTTEEADDESSDTDVMEE